MIVKRVPHGLDDHLLVEAGEPRAEGLHVSTLYGALYKRLDPRRFTDEPPNPLLLAIGLAWERYFEQVLVQAGVNASRPAPFTTPDGIHLSPDLLIVDDENHVRIGEIKYTSMSVSETLDEPKFDRYKTQVKVYAHHLGIYRVRFYIYFAVRPVPQLRAFDVELTPQECADEWAACVNVGRSEGLLP